MMVEEMSGKGKQGMHHGSMGIFPCSMPCLFKSPMPPPPCLPSSLLSCPPANVSAHFLPTNKCQITHTTRPSQPNYQPPFLLPPSSSLLLPENKTEDTHMPFLLLLPPPTNVVRGEGHKAMPW